MILSFVWSLCCRTSPRGVRQNRTQAVGIQGASKRAQPAFHASQNAQCRCHQAIAAEELSATTKLYVIGAIVHCAFPAVVIRSSVTIESCIASNKECTAASEQQVQHNERIRRIWYTISMLGNVNFMLLNSPRDMIDTGRLRPGACIDGECMHRKKSAGSETTRAKSQP
jgi:hypothetical protein